jgi:hypothetical protein
MLAKEREAFMNKDSEIKTHSELIEEDLDNLDNYDLSQGVRGKYYQQYQELNDKIPVIIKTENEDKKVILHSIKTRAILDKNGKLTAQIISDLLPGEYEITLTIEEPKS